MKQSTRSADETINKEAIVGCAFNYDTSQILPFLHSLEKVGFRGDLILLINDNSRIDTSAFSYQTNFLNPVKTFSFHKKVLELVCKIFRKLGLENAMQSVIFKSAGRRLQKDKNLNRWQIAYFYSFYYLMTSRFFLYYYFLKDRDYAKVLFTDTSDVFFQGYPFPETDETCVLAFGENEFFRIGKEKFNSYWIKKGFGEKALEQVSNANIYCAGTIIAQGQPITTFLKDFMKVVMNYKIPGFIEGIDQGVYNFMISYLQLPNFILQDNGEHVFTMGLHSASEIVKADGKLYLKAKKNYLPNIIHQYNRHSALTEECIHNLSKDALLLAE